MTLKIHISEHDDDLHHTTAKRNLAGGVAGLDGSGNILDTSGNIALTDDLKDIVNGVPGLDASGDVLDSVLPGILEYYIISNDELHNNNSERTMTGTVYVKKKQITINTLYPTPSTLRVTFEMKCLQSGGAAKGRIYKNGGAIGTERSTVGGVYIEYSEDISFAEGDTIELWLKNTVADRIVAVQKLRVEGKVTPSLTRAITSGDFGVIDGWSGTDVNY